MNTHSYRRQTTVRFGWIVVLGGMLQGALAVSGCWDASPCDPGEILKLNSCTPAPPDAGTAAPDAGNSTGGQGGAGGSGGATGGRPAADKWSYQLCATDADCGGHTPTCTMQAPPPSTTLYCTNSPCETGAKDTCPVGGHCSDAFASFGAPNFCAKD